MRSQLYYLCLLAVYVAASPLQNLHNARRVAAPAVHLTRDGRMQDPHKRSEAAPTPLALLRSRRATADDGDDCEDEISYSSTTTKVIPVTATKTKTFSVTATRTTSKTNTRFSTSTATKTVTKNVPQSTKKTSTTSKATSKPKTTTKTTSKASSTKAQAATTTLSTLVTPIPTSKNYVFTGISSWYYTGLGACGWWSNDGEMVAAVPDHVYDNFPNATPEWNTNGNPVCGQKIDVKWGGKTIRVTVVDRCVGCNTYQIDLSPTAFGALADGDLDRGLLYDITWQWV